MSHILQIKIIQFRPKRLLLRLPFIVTISTTALSKKKKKHGLHPFVHQTVTRLKAVFLSNICWNLKICVIRKDDFSQKYFSLSAHFLELLLQFQNVVVLCLASVFIYALNDVCLLLKNRAISKTH